MEGEVGKHSGTAPPLYTSALVLGSLFRTVSKKRRQQNSPLTVQRPLDNVRARGRSPILFERPLNFKSSIRHFGGRDYSMRTALLLFLTVLLIVPPAVSQPRDDRLIVPGVQIGKWRLGVSIDELVRTHGEPTVKVEFLRVVDEADFVRDVLEYGWDDDDMGVFTFGHPFPEVLEEGRHGAFLPYRTMAGVSLRSTRADILRAYGKPTAVSTPKHGYARLIYDALGIAFQVQAGSVYSIAIFKPRSARQIWRF